MIRPGVIAAAAIVELGASDPAFALAVNAEVIEQTLDAFSLWPTGPRFYLLDSLPPYMRRLVESASRTRASEATQPTKGSES